VDGGDSETGFGVVGVDIIIEYDSFRGLYEMIVGVRRSVDNKG